MANGKAFKIVQRQRMIELIAHEPIPNLDNMQVLLHNRKRMAKIMIDVDSDSKDYKLAESVINNINKIISENLYLTPKTDL